MKRKEQTRKVERKGVKEKEKLMSTQRRSREGRKISFEVLFFFFLPLSQSLTLLSTSKHQQKEEKKKKKNHIEKEKGKGNGRAQTPKSEAQWC